jgi:hypothetical protein
MVMFFTVTLILSILGMLFMLWLKRFELTTGRLVMSGVRPLVGERLAAAAQWLQERMPALLRKRVERLGQELLSFTHRTTAFVVVSVEHALERVLHTVREKTSVSPQGGEASAFLRQVADHKKELQRSRESSSIK